MFEGVPTYPNASRCWDICDKYGVTIFYTAPTAIRALMREGDAWVSASSRRSLRLLGSVGEPINPEAWLWYHRVVGGERCPIRRHVVADRDGRHLDCAATGGDHLEARFCDAAVFRRESRADGAGRRGAARRVRGKSGLARQLARSDAHGLWGPSTLHRHLFQDVSGVLLHRRRLRAATRTVITGSRAGWTTSSMSAGTGWGTAEVESALVAHGDVAESAVVGFPHEIKGQGIYAFVTLKEGRETSARLLTELQQFVRKQIRPHRDARRHSMGTRPAEDAQRQDHAAHFAQDRRQRGRAAGRYVGTGGPRGGARLDRKRTNACAPPVSDGPPESHARVLRSRHRSGVRPSV